MKSHLLIFLIATIFLCSGSITKADSIPGLFNTGIDDAGNVLSLNSIDPHWELSFPAGITIIPAYVTRNSNWLIPPSGSFWIAPVPGLAYSYDGIYSYKLEFNLTGLDPNTVVIIGEWASDNVSSIWLNGIDTGLEQEDQFYFLKTFYLQTGQNISFLSGINVLEFRVENMVGSNPNPSGLLVAGLQGSANPVSEPATMLLFGSGFLGLLGFHRKKLEH